MGYTLRAQISTGRIDAGDLGSFEIRDGELEAEDYATAATLVERYHVEWPDGDPGPEEWVDDDEYPDPDEGTEAEADAADVDEESEDGAEFDAAEFVDRTPMATVIDDLESGDYDEHLDAIEGEASRRGVLDAVSARREE